MLIPVMVDGQELIQDIIIPSFPALEVDEKTFEKLDVRMAEAAIVSVSSGNYPRQAARDEMVKLNRLAYAQ